MPGAKRKISLKWHTSSSGVFLRNCFCFRDAASGSLHCGYFLPNCELFFVNIVPCNWFMVLIPSWVLSVLSYFLAFWGVLAPFCKYRSYSDRTDKKLHILWGKWVGGGLFKLGGGRVHLGLSMQYNLTRQGANHVSLIFCFNLFSLVTVPSFYEIRVLFLVFVFLSHGFGASLPGELSCIPWALLETYSPKPFPNSSPDLELIVTLSSSSRISNKRTAETHKC